MNGTEHALLVPRPDEESAGFWEGAASGELRIQACSRCGRLRHPPRPMCPHCHAMDREWRTVSGRASLWSFVVPHPPLLPGFAELAPYNVVVVALEEDPVIRLVGNVVPHEGVRLDAEINSIDPAGLSIGAPVHAVFGKRTGPDGSELTLPYWVLG